MMPLLDQMSVATASKAAMTSTFPLGLRAIHVSPFEERRGPARARSEADYIESPLAPFGPGLVRAPLSL
jgi:hypothetical protein